MKNILFLIILIFISACNDSDGGYSSENEMSLDMDVMDEAMMKALPRSQSPQESPAQEVSTKKVIKTGSITFQSEDIEKDYQTIVKLLPKLNAYIENENQSKNEYSHRLDYNLKIRVASHTYDSLFSSLANISINVDSKSSNIEDVTRQFYDLKLRIRNKKALEQRYVELLKKANSIKDILEIERNLNNIRTDIEQMKSQFNYLSQQINYSTIHLSFYETLPNAPQRQGFGARIVDAMSSGWQGFLSFIVGLISLWPFVFVGLATVFLFNRIKKMWSRKS